MQKCIAMHKNMHLEQKISKKFCQSNKKVANNKGLARIEKLARFLLIK